MKRFLLVIIILFVYSVNTAAGTEQIDKAYTYAKKGMQYGLSNLKDKKSRDEFKLIESDKLIAEVKISKEIGGVKIEAKGLFEGEEVSIVTYRSYEALVKDGYIDKNSDLMKE